MSLIMQSIASSILYVIYSDGASLATRNGSNGTGITGSLKWFVYAARSAVPCGYGVHPARANSVSYVIVTHFLPTALRCKCKDQ